LSCPDGRQPEWQADRRTISPSNVLWPHATGAARARWAAQAVERYLHMARIILTRAAAWPAPKAPLPPQALELARQLYEAIERWVDELGRPSRSDVLCARCGAQVFFPYSVIPDEETCPAICEPCGGSGGLISASAVVPAGTGR